MSILIGIFTFVLILISVFLVLVVLAQKAQTDGAMGATLGGGATEAAFGADTGNVLTKATKNAAILFFVLTFGLYLAHIYVSKTAKDSGGQLPTIEAPAAAPATAPDASTSALEAPSTSVAPEEAPSDLPAVTLPTTETSDSNQP